jgi:arabinose-5-phosphate isomerase
MLTLVELAKEVIRTEIEGLAYMESRIGPEFDVAVRAIMNTQGRTIICGMGKSGIIGKKIAASFASTGTPSFFMHPGEAFHGDLGMVKPEDIFIAISYSGETDEVLKLIPFLHGNGNFIISLTGNAQSNLALNAHCHLDIKVPKEACLLQLAPTSSTTATLVMGDALTVALMKTRGFQPENFAKFHPGGMLGRRLLLKVKDEMVSKGLPIVNGCDDFFTVVQKISGNQLGLTLVNLDCASPAIITDGDIRRAMEYNGKNVFNLKAKDISSINPISISENSSIDAAYEKMSIKAISSLVVIENGKIVGILKK